MTTYDQAYDKVVTAYRATVFKSFNTLFLTDREYKLLEHVGRYFYTSTLGLHYKKETKPSKLRLKQALQLLH